MKWLGLFISICFFIFACVSEYEPSSIEIRLSRSVKILDDFGEEESITDANVFIECDQGFTFGDRKVCTTEKCAMCTTSTAKNSSW